MKRRSSIAAAVLVLACAGWAAAPALTSRSAAPEPEAGGTTSQVPSVACETCVEVLRGGESRWDCASAAEGYHACTATEDSCRESGLCDVDASAGGGTLPVVTYGR